MNLSRKKISIIKNVARALYNYKRKKVLLDNLPTVLWIEPTNKCNLKCIMCPQSLISEGQLGFMDWHVYKKIIDEAKQFTSSAYLLLAGESLLHKDIYKMIRYAADNNIRPLVNTNGTTLTSEGKRVALLESGVKHITFAFDGYNKETYEKTRIGAKYEDVIRGIREFLKEKKKRNLKEPYVAITTLEIGKDCYKDKEKSKKKFYESFEGLPVDQFIVKTPNTWGGEFKDTDKFTPPPLDKNRFYPCSHLWSTMSICWDGTVVPCCFEYFNNYVLGNVKEKSLKDIWNDEPMLKLRRAMLDGTYHALDPTCEDCAILYLDAILGIPAGMRTAVKDAITNLVGMRAEKYLIMLAKKIKPSYSLRIENKPLIKMITAKQIKENFPKDIHTKDPLLSKYLLRPIAFPLAARFVNAGCSANHVSFLAMATLLAGLFLFLPATYLTNVIAAFLLHLYILLDSTDGCVARATNTESKYGELLEAVNGYLIGGTSYLAIGWAASTPFTSFSPYYSLLGGLTCICNLLIRVINLKEQKIFPSTNTEKMGIPQLIDKNFGVGGLFHPLVVICALFNILHWFVITYFIYYILAAVIFIIHRLVKYRKVKN